MTFWMIASLKPRIHILMMNKNEGGHKSNKYDGGNEIGKLKNEGGGLFFAVQQSQTVDL